MFINLEILQNSIFIVKIGDMAGYFFIRLKPSSSHPVIPPIIFLTGLPILAERIAAFSVALQCGPAQ
jgi:hypothetical protein